MCALKLASHEAKAIAAELHGSTIDLDAEEPAAEPAAKVRRTAAKSSAAGQRMFEKVLFFFRGVCISSSVASWSVEVVFGYVRVLVVSCLSQSASQ